MTVVESDKYFNKMSDSDRKEYEAHTAVYVDKLASLPKGSNELLFLNSPEATSFITFVEPTAIDEKDTSQEFKMMAYYWNDRNKKMAGHIHAVAVAHPGKKIAVFFGAAHIRPVRAELNKLGMNYRVLTLTDIQLPTK
jgi:erythromycin esterase-like protein